MPEEDYGILPALNIDLCSPVLIEKAGRRGLGARKFLKNDEIAIEWLTNLTEQSGKIKKLLKFYK